MDENISVMFFNMVCPDTPTADKRAVSCMNYVLCRYVKALNF
jgi:hypothetical protein